MIYALKNIIIGKKRYVLGKKKLQRFFLVYFWDKKVHYCVIKELHTHPK